MSTSNRLIPLARALDRLPPGQYTIALTIPPHKRHPWQATITHNQPIQHLQLPRLPDLEPLPLLHPDTKLTF